MIRKLLDLWRRHGARDTGAAAVEFAIVAPILIVLALGVADYGLLVNNSATLLGATRAGAEYAKANWNNPAVTNAATVTTQVACGFAGLTLSAGSCSPITPSVSTTCSCADGSSVACPTASGSNPCAAKSDPRVLVYVSLTATQTFTPLFAVTGFAYPNPLTATTVVRTQ